ncbi:hypothetical protein BV882_16125 [Streptomyces sp. 46]|nr:hypothetical protein BV882_16125 [Streptomyces sp. 46]
MGQLREIEPVRVLLDDLTGATLQWAPQGGPYDEYGLAGRGYQAPVGFSAYQAGLIARLLAEQAGGEALFELVGRCRPRSDRSGAGAEREFPFWSTASASRCARAGP